MNKKMLITGVVTVGILIGGASIVGASMNDDHEAIVKSQTVKSDDVVIKEDAAAEKNLLTFEEAKEIALSEQDGYIDDIELETDDGYTYYEVEIENRDAEYDIYIDAYTGEILKVETDDDNHHEHKNNKSLDSIMSAEEAMKMAVETVGGTVIEIELDEDDHRYEYEIDIKTNAGKVELTMDAVTGKILEQELDD